MGVVLFSKNETPQSRRYLSSFLFVVSIMEDDIFERSGVDYSITNLFLDIQEFIF